MDTNAGSADASLQLSSARLASLSDTMFGVAMTLVVATLLPAIQQHKGRGLAWLGDIDGEFATVVISFSIAARYWVVQQQRLAMTAALTSRQVTLHLVFLFLIVVVPLSTSLPGLAGADAIRGSVVIYGAHLMVIALVNLLLWLEVHRDVAAHPQVTGGALALALFALAVAVGTLRPSLAVYFWVAALAGARLGRVLAPRLWRAKARGLAP